MLNTIKINRIETIDFEFSQDRVLAEDIYSKTNVPEFDNSAVDGFGFINSNKIKRELKIVGESRPGKPFLNKVSGNQAIKVFTGAYLLKEITKINTVCMEEDTVTQGNKLKLEKKFKTG